MPEPARPLGTDDADDLRLYLEAAAREPLLTKEEEVELAMTIEARQGGRGAPPRRASAVREEHRQGPPRRAQGRGGAPAIHHGEPASGGVRGPQVPGSGAPAPRPDPGGQHRPDARRRAVRLAPRVQVLHVRHVVDPPGHHARDRRSLALDPSARPHPRPAAQAEPHAVPVRAVDGSRALARGAGQGARHHGRGDRRPDRDGPPRAAVPAVARGRGHRARRPDRGGRLGCAAFNEVEDALLREEIGDAVDRVLDERERHVVALRYGLENGQPLACERPARCSACPASASA